LTRIFKFAIIEIGGDEVMSITVTVAGIILLIVGMLVLRSTKKHYREIWEKYVHRWSQKEINWLIEQERKELIADYIFIFFGLLVIAIGVFINLPF
jgi:uncharacterized membrane protein